MQDLPNGTADDVYVVVKKADVLKPFHQLSNDTGIQLRRLIEISCHLQYVVALMSGASLDQGVGARQDC